MVVGEWGSGLSCFIKTWTTYHNSWDNEFCSPPGNTAREYLSISTGPPNHTLVLQQDNDTEHKLKKILFLEWPAKHLDLDPFRYCSMTLNTKFILKIPTLINEWAKIPQWWCYKCIALILNSWWQLLLR